MPKRSDAASCFAAASALTLLMLAAAPALRARGAQRSATSRWRSGSAPSPPTRASRTASSSSWSTTASPSSTSATRWRSRSRSATRPSSSPLEPFFEAGEFGTPGDYRAWFIPTRAGPVHVPLHRHDRRRGGRRDVHVGAGDVRRRREPAADPVPRASSPRPVSSPSGSTSEVPRLTSSIGDVPGRGERGGGRRIEREDASASIGLIVGAIGLIVAIVALVASRRRPKEAA